MIIIANKSSSDAAAEGCLTAIVGSFFLLIVTGLMFVMAFYYAWVFTYLWDWFIVYPFKDMLPSLRSLTMAEAYGIMLVLGFLNHGKATSASLLDCKRDEPSTAERLSAYFVVPFISPLITLIIGYLVYINFIFKG